MVKDGAPVAIDQAGEYTCKGTGFEDEVRVFKRNPKVKIPVLDDTITGGMHVGEKQRGIDKLDGTRQSGRLLVRPPRPYRSCQTAEDSPEEVLFVLKCKKE